MTLTFNLADLTEAAVDRVPDRQALITAERTLTYAELEDRANRLAAWLAAQGIGPGDHVGCYLFNGTEYVETMLAAYKLRAVPINVNYRYVEDELRYLFRDADLKALVHDAEFTPRIEAVRDGLPLLATTLAVGATTATTSRRSRLRRLSGCRYSAAATTSTSSTPAARPACRRASCGGRRMRSTRASVAATTAEPIRSRPPRRCPSASATRWCSCRWRRSCTVPRNGRCSRG